VENRNDISKLVEAGIPVTLSEFRCGCWGKHQPPTLTADSITVTVGEGYRSNKHSHGQNVYVIAVDPTNHVALIEMRKWGDFYGAGLWHYLVGVDGSPFVAQVSSNINNLADALESLKPAEVKRAEAAGTRVKRQGDWYFVPVNRAPRGKVQSNVALDDDHIAAEFIGLRTAVYVRSGVTHRQHATVHLVGWHKAIRNNAIRTGRLARGRGAD
jgi:hypothetical protein